MFDKPTHFSDCPFGHQQGIIGWEVVSIQNCLGRPIGLRHLISVGFVARICGNRCCFHCRWFQSNWHVPDILQSQISARDSCCFGSVSVCTEKPFDPIIAVLVISVYTEKSTNFRIRKNDIFPYTEKRSFSVYGIFAPIVSARGLNCQRTATVAGCVCEIVSIVRLLILSLVGYAI